jgi:xanthine/uracil/vitamin C permease (AzgA family)
MGLGANFTYSVVKGMGLDWHAALGAVLSGVAFLLLTAAGIRQRIVNAPLQMQPYSVRQFSATALQPDIHGGLAVGKKAGLFQPAGSVPRLNRILYRLTMLAIPLTYSIANGLAFGFCAWKLIKLCRGRYRQVDWIVYCLTALFLLRFYHLGKGN